MTSERGVGRGTGGRAGDRRTKVLFVAGFDRSGSTLLDLMLGQLPGFVSTGELEFIWERGMRRNEPCGCGNKFYDCPFWSEVLRVAFGPDGAVDFEAAIALRRSVERLRNVPALAVGGLRTDELTSRVDAYGELLGPLLAAVLSVSGGSVIVDSSKNAVHGLTLAALPYVDLHVVHLVRDSRAVAFSLQRVKERSPGFGGRQLRRMPPTRAAVAWTVANGLVHLLRQRAGSFVRIRYKDLVRAPRLTVASLATQVDARPSDLDFIGDGTIHLSGTHTVSGNPIRLRHGTVTLGLDAEWREHMTARDRRLVTALTWPLLLKYGFLRPDGWVR